MNKVILLVEDNPSDEKLALLAFKHCGVDHDIAVARDGGQALDYLFTTGVFATRGPGMPALVLLDLQLPKIEGLEVLRRLRLDTRTKLLPVVVLTSSREEEDIARGYSLGANGYVRKPLAFAEFAKVATTLGLFWLVMNEAPSAPGSAS